MLNSVTATLHQVDNINGRAAGLGGSHHRFHHGHGPQVVPTASSGLAPLLNGLCQLVEEGVVDDDACRERKRRLLGRRLRTPARVRLGRNVGEIRPGDKQAPLPRAPR